MAEEKLFAEFPPVAPEKWDEQINKELKGKDYDETLVWKTFEGIAVKPFYTQKDLSENPLKNTIPASYPFVRGNRINGNQWEIRQDIKVEAAAVANSKALDILNKGVTSVGFITEDEKIVSQLVKNIFPEHAAVNFITKENTEAVLNAFLQEISSRNTNPALINGAVSFDPLIKLITDRDPKFAGSDYFDAASRIVHALRDYTLFRGINISADIYHNSGGSAIQELAFSIAQGNEYLVNLTERNLSIDDISACIQFTYAVGPSYLMEIAKLRAARMLWAKVVEQYKPQHTCSMATFIHCTTSSWNITSADAHNNLLRTTTEAMSAAIGGANSVEVLPFDLAKKSSDDFSERLARNIQLICAEEAYLNKVADPAGGSYYIEELTEKLVKEAWKLFQQIENIDGFIAAAEKGFIHEQLEKTAAIKQEAFNTGKAVLIGNTKYVNPLDSPKEQQLKKLFNSSKGQEVNQI
jgi:methylmalonyl-CoA mutase